MQKVMLGVEEFKKLATVHGLTQYEGGRIRQSGIG
jgi:hypothetical protein